MTWSEDWGTTEYTEHTEDGYCAERPASHICWFWSASILAREVAGGDAVDVLSDYRRVSMLNRAEICVSPVPAGP